MGKRTDQSLAETTQAGSSETVSTSDVSEQNTTAAEKLPPDAEKTEPPKERKEVIIRHPSKKAIKIIVMNELVVFGEDGVAKVDVKIAGYLLSIPGYEEVI
jgi:hypothetical protein